MTSTTVFEDDDAYRDRLKNAVVLALAGLAALGSLFSVMGALPSFTSPEAYAITRSAEGIAGLFFAALYLLLGVRPRSYPGVWELAILHRIVMVGGDGLLVAGGAVGAVPALLRDLIIAALLIGAYLYGKGHTVWRRE